MEPAPRSWSSGALVGGAANLAGYIEVLRKQNPGKVLLLDAGDMWQGTLVSDLDEGRPMVRLYNLLKYDAAAIGNHEFDFGPVGPLSTPTSELDDSIGAIEANSTLARFPLLVSNAVFKETGEPIAPNHLKPYTIIGRAGTKIGVIGVTTKDTDKTTHPANVRGIRFLPSQQVVPGYVKKLRNMGVKIVVILAHMGADWEAGSGEYVGEVADLASAVGPDSLGLDAADLICAAHTHSRLDAVIHGVPVVQAYAYQTAFSRVDIPLDQAGSPNRLEILIHPPRTLWYEGKVKYMGQAVKPVEDVSDFVEKLTVPIRRLENYRITRLEKRLTRLGKTGSPLGSLVTSAMLAFVPGADMAVTNSGAIRADLGPGTITYGKLYKTLPFADHLVSAELTGKQVFKMFEESLRNGLLELSGASVTFNLSRPEGHRVVEIVIRGKGKLRPRGRYKVVLQDFLLAGGDGFRIFDHARAVKHHKVSMREAVVKYLQKLDNGSPLFANYPRYEFQANKAAGRNRHEKSKPAADLLFRE